MQVPPGLAWPPAPRLPQPPAGASGPWQLLRPGWRQCRGLRMRSLSGAATRFRRAHFLVTPPEAWLAGFWPASWRILCLHLIASKLLGKQEGMALKSVILDSLEVSRPELVLLIVPTRFLLPAEVIFFWEWRRGWAVEGPIEQGPSPVPGAGAGAWLSCCCDKQLRADPAVSMPRLGVGRASPGPLLYPPCPPSLAWCTRHPLRNSQAQQRPKSHVSLSFSGPGL